ncbi:hypothetical protein DFH09DRAFT_1284395 [Mycena vulgaris]|nr:hypothetical protein DFH09DRAFT_1284395 [Mycena vulgaris]
MTAPPNPAFSFSPQTPATETQPDWLASSLTTVKFIVAGVECIPFPYVKGVFGMVVIILEMVEICLWLTWLVQKVKRNRDGLKELCGNIVEIIKIIQDQLIIHGNTGVLKFKGLCEDLASVLEHVLQSIRQLPTEPRGLRGRFKKVMKLSSMADKISGYRMRVQELQSNFMDLGNQYIFLLDGLGGAGKTQIALKYIEESSHFSDIFLIDTSTTEKIDTGLKNIAATQNAGSTAQDGLDWLCSKPSG